VEARETTTGPAIALAEPRPVLAASDDAPSFARMLAQSMVDDAPLPAPASSSSVPLRLPACMTPAELAMALRCSPPQGSLPQAVREGPSLSLPAGGRPLAESLLPSPQASGERTVSMPLSAMPWQITMRATPLPAAADAFDNLRARIERDRRPTSTLDVRVNEFNRREVKVSPRAPGWRGPMCGKRLAEKVCEMRRGAIGWAELDDFIALASPRLSRLSARWARVAGPGGARVGEALEGFRTALDAMEKATRAKSVAELQGVDLIAQQAARQLLLARGRD
jgi:hypothetical protein